MHMHLPTQRYFTFQFMTLTNYVGIRNFTYASCAFPNFRTFDIFLEISHVLYAFQLKEMGHLMLMQLLYVSSTRNFTLCKL